MNVLECKPDPGTRGGIGAADRCNLRAWFAFFLAWLAGLTAVSHLGWQAAEAGGSRFGLGLWLGSVYAIYLSLCCTFFPAPTTWIVLLAASNEFAAMVGVHGHGVERLVVVATVGAIATGLANLNEYHLFTYFLRFGRVSRVRDTRLYRASARWFATNPFWVIALFSFIPIPVDVVRWLAITYRYPRRRFFGASTLGRWFRYAAWATASIGLSLSARQIVMIQLGLVGLVIVRIAPRFVRQIRAGDEERAIDAPSGAWEAIVSAEAGAIVPKESTPPGRPGMPAAPRAPVKPAPLIVGSMTETYNPRTERTDTR